MKLIHSNPDCRDIAIWFDEFLTPGESFKEGIDKILHNSQLFTLLVTPNILEEPNFVMGEEYPAAQKSGINILPAEMVETDKNALKEKYRDIPECVNPEATEFYTQLLDSVTKIATQANNTPEHNFLIGLAYLDGIDVEVNREFALELITSAAEAGLPEATEKLRDMYFIGVGVQLDYRKAVVWAEKYADYMVETYGEECPDTLTAIHNLAISYSNLGEYKKALELTEKVYTFFSNTFGEEHPDTLISLNNIASTYSNIGDYKKL
ncbi:MAG: SEL1-like repeat protein [Clostridia bacterium]|nr:SEL1-like repeat protein [Clostridia bacterium]